MSSKRPFPSSPASSTPPRPLKRQRALFPPPTTPLSSSPFAHSTPSDSPTNPFGLKRTLFLARNPALPRPTSFSKHLPLRFTLVSRNHPRGEVWRIVQVPLSYTFRHLHKLVLFLFGGDEAEKNAHLFEVQKTVAMWKPLYKKQGVIKSARTWAHLSSVRDPYRPREDEAEGEEDADAEGEVDEEEDEWRWEAEEDFTLSHAWPRGGDLARSITYTHDISPTSPQVHITLNTAPIPARKGVGNKPFVFSAKGVGFSFSSTSSPSAPPVPARVTRSGKSTSKAGTEQEDVGKWNTHDAFQRFLERFRSSTPDPHLDDDADADGDVDPDASSSSFYSDPLTPITPFPSNPLHRARVDHAHRRMVRLNRRGLEVVLPDEEEERDELEEDQDEGEEGNDLFASGDEAELCR